ncbi:Smr/MutS family protein [Candidatus Falkowbacteria bacterium]|nr:Smr/MutS family protein [Candidatus Falkowbacteria bacterium]
MKMRRLKQNKYEQRIDAELDLHGYTQAEARSLLLELLDEARDCGYRRLRIVTGKGLHSPDGVGVIKELVENMLTRAGHRFTEGKLNEGGGGVLVVTLTW